MYKNWKILNVIIYHYLKNNEEYIFDCPEREKDEFVSQINFLKTNSEIIDPKDNEKLFYYLRNDNDSNKGYLLTFDEGYKDHYYWSRSTTSNNYHVNLLD